MSHDYVNNHLIFKYTLDKFIFRMLSAIKGTQDVIQQGTHLLLGGVGADIQGNDGVFYNIDDIRHSQDALPERYTITIGPELNTKKVVIFNSLTFHRLEVVTFFVSTPFIQVSNSIKFHLIINIIVLFLKSQ